MTNPDDPLRYLTLQFLDWIAAAPRTYGEVIDAWRTSCPRLTVWEEAIEKGLVRRISGGSMSEAQVVITDKGRAALETAHIPPTAATASKRARRAQ
ncbi:MAG: hypothetical protein GEU95_06545 [Rhizobiales bacterium]|nr:hypothetical protein [Hyphomicrobiales bacterium]